MQYSIELPGFEGQDIKVDQIKFFKAPKIYVDGEQAPKGSKWLSQGLTQNDGTSVDVRMVNNFVDPIPSVMIGNEKYHPTEPLTWGQYLWAGWPVAMVFIGGLVGALFGVAAGMANGRIMRSETMSSTMKWLSTGGISLVAVILSVAVAFAIAG
ncbi:MAG: hypothetical protein AAF902_18955 [Chloroflexota bacterium]